MPMAFREAYPDAVFQSINPSNYTEFVYYIIPSALIASVRVNAEKLLFNWERGT